MNTLRIGAMPVPPDFRHGELMRRGRPRHGAGDEFRLRHPAMDVGHRAKIFAPFDALAGFRDAIAAEASASARRSA